ncbi:tetratricopeptide repeat protein [Patescibacteria group bacterium]|nr:tetratricopeptide repeat protein [Patescibacteria group bacterium]MCL5409933.1 tetratricopeptide repeat protein [Patescibacteria group bacterium]
MNTTKILATIKNKWVHLFCLTLLVLICYLGILQNGFAWDDEDFFLNWPTIKDSQEISAVLSIPDLLAGSLPSNHQGVYRPIRSVYYLASYKIWGEDAFGYHLQAIIVHLLVVLLIYFITEEIFKQRLLAFLSAAFFATHPIHTEAISYTAASLDSLGILFFFAAFYFYLRSTNSVKRNIPAIILSIIYTGLAFFTYEMTLVLPILIVFYDYTFNFLTRENWRQRLSVYKPYLSLWLFYLVVRFLWLQIGDRADYLGNGMLLVAQQARTAILVIYAHYLSWLVLPLHQNILPNINQSSNLDILAFVNKFRAGQLTSVIIDYSALIPVFFLISGILATLFLLKKHKLVAFSLGWLLISLTTVSSILPQGAPIAERYLYIGSFGYTLILAFLVIYISHLTPRVLRMVIKGYISHTSFLSYSLIVSASLAIVVSYTYLTINRNFDWHNYQSLWESVVREDPNNSYAYEGLGYQSFERGNINEAINLYQKTISLNPQQTRARTNLASAYIKQQQYDLALQQLQLTLDIDTNNPIAYELWGDIAMVQKNYKLAIEKYQQALQIAPQYSFYNANLGSAYEQNGQYQQALTQYQTAISLNPNSADYYYHISNIYYHLGHQDLAIQAINLSLEFDPNNNIAKELKELLQNQ